MVTSFLDIFGLFLSCMVSSRARPRTRAVALLLRRPGAAGCGRSHAGPRTRRVHRGRRTNALHCAGSRRKPVVRVRTRTFRRADAPTDPQGNEGKSERHGADVPRRCEKSVVARPFVGAGRVSGLCRRPAATARPALRNGAVCGLRQAVCTFPKSHTCGFRTMQHGRFRARVRRPERSAQKVAAPGAVGFREAGRKPALGGSRTRSR